jgi:hypothetical protein
MTGEELKKRRLLCSYGMSIFARRIGIRPSRLCDFEHGRSPIPDWLKQRIESFFDHHINLLSESKDPWKDCWEYLEL